MELDEIKQHIIYMSGSGKRLSSQRRHGIYSTFTLPGLHTMPGVRNTEKRFSDFGIPEDMHGCTFLDIGCNVGAMAFEAALRGADVMGIEYRSDRVALCRMIAKTYNLEDTCEFQQADLNALEGTEDWADVTYDYVLCSSVDAYIKDVPGFYRFLMTLTKRALYLESNIQRNNEQITTTLLLDQAFAGNVRYLGNGDSGGISRKRKLYEVTP